MPVNIMRLSEHFDIWEDGEIYCVGLVFSIEDLK